MAVFAALLLGLSPLFLPLATSFMNDVPGCFCMLLAMFGMIRCAGAKSQRTAMGWLSIAVMMGVIGGMSRQTVWIVPIILLPYLAWIRRDCRLAALVAWLVTLVVAVNLQHWFNAQPYALPEPSIQSEWADFARDPYLTVLRFIRILLTIVLLLLPATVPFLSRLRAWPAMILIIIVLLAIGRFLWSEPRFAVAPWMENTLTPVGILGGAQIAGQRSVVLPSPILPLLSLAVFVVSAALIAVAAANLSKMKNFLKSPAMRTSQSVR